MTKKTHEKMFTISGHKGNANQNHTNIPPHPVKIAIIKNTTTSRCWQACEDKEPSYIAGGNASECSHFGKQYGGFLKN
jgi:hypothetical protein